MSGVESLRVGLLDCQMCDPILLEVLSDAASIVRGAINCVVGRTQVGRTASARCRRLGMPESRSTERRGELNCQHGRDALLPRRMRDARLARVGVSQRSLAMAMGETDHSLIARYEREGWCNACQAGTRPSPAFIYRWAIALGACCDTDGLNDVLEAAGYIAFNVNVVSHGRCRSGRVQRKEPTWDGVQLYLAPVAASPKGSTSPRERGAVLLSGLRTNPLSATPPETQRVSTQIPRMPALKP